MHRIRFLLFLLLFLQQMGYSQVGSWKNYTQMQNVNKFLLTEKGIWAATTGGVFFYSYDTKEYDKITSTEGLKSINITALAKDKFNRMWFGASDGSISLYNINDKTWDYIVVIYSSEKIKKQINEITIIDSLAYICSDFGISLVNVNNLKFGDTYNKLGSLGTDTKVYSIYKEDTVWAATENGIAIQKSGKSNYLTPDNWTNFTNADGLPTPTITYKILRYKDTIYAATSKGVYTLNNNLFVPKFQQIMTNIIYDMVVKNDTLFIAANSNVYYYANGKFEYYYNVNFERIKDLDYDNKYFYLGNQSGVAEIKQNNTKILYPNSPSANLFPSIVVDDNGSLWSASGGEVVAKGFYKLTDSIWKNYLVSSYPSMGTNVYHKVNKTSNNTLWFSSWGGGILKVTKDSVFTRYYNNTPLPGVDTNFIVMNGVAEDSKGNLWFLCRETKDKITFAKLKPDSTWEMVTNTFNPTVSFYTDILIDNLDTKYVIHEAKGSEGGIYYYNETGATQKTWGFITTANGLSSSGVNGMALDKNGEIWIATKGGLNVILNPYRPELQIINNYIFRNININCVAVDGLNRKWIGTQNGAWLISSDGLELIAYYNVKNSPILSDNIISIATNNKTGMVYFATDNGISTLQTNAIEPNQEFDELNIYPNPFLIRKHSQITIDGLVAGSQIKIFSVSGSLIRNLTTPGGRIAFWDGRDEKGNEVSSGIYFITAYNEQGDKIKTGKIAIVKQ